MADPPALPRPGGWPAWWWAVAALALLAAARAAWLALGSEPLVEGTDAVWYDTLGRNLLEGKGLSLSRGEPLVPTMYREPGYAAFLAAVYALAGPRPEVVPFVQAALLGATVPVVAALAARLGGGPPVAVLAAALTALSPDQADLARQVLSETLFTLLLYVSLLLALRARHHGQPGAFARLGLLFGVLALVRVQGQLLFLLLLPLWLLLDRRELGRWRLGHLALVGGLALLVTLPWTLRNVAVFQKSSLTQRYGAALLPRAVRATYGPEQNLAWVGQAAWMAANPYSALLVPLDRFQYGPQYFENDIWDFHLVLSTKAVGWGARVCDAAEEQGPGVIEAALRTLPFDPRTPLDATGWQAKFEDCGLAMGLRLIRERPLAYLLQTPFEWVKLNFYPLPSRLSLYRNTLVWAAFVTVAVLAMRRRLRGDGLWLAAFAAVYNAQAVAADPAERYAAPLLPLYYSFATLGLLATARALGGWVANVRAR